MKCKYCNSENLILEKRSKDNKHILDAQQVALICGDCGKYIKWCPKDERKFYWVKMIAPSPTKAKTELNNNSKDKQIAELKQRLAEKDKEIKQLKLNYEYQKRLRAEEGKEWGERFAQVCDELERVKKAKNDGLIEVLLKEQRYQICEKIRKSFEEEIIKQEKFYGIDGIKLNFAYIGNLVCEFDWKKILDQIEKGDENG